MNRTSTCNGSVLHNQAICSIFAACMKLSLDPWLPIEHPTNHHVVKCAVDLAHIIFVSLLKMKTTAILFTYLSHIMTKSTFAIWEQEIHGPVSASEQSGSVTLLFAA